MVLLPASCLFPPLGCRSEKGRRRSLISHSLHRAWHRIGAQRPFFIVLNKRNELTRNFTVGHEWENGNKSSGRGDDEEDSELHILLAGGTVCARRPQVKSKPKVWALKSHAPLRNCWGLKDPYKKKT